MALWELYKGRDYHILPSLERIERAARFIGNPQREFPALLVGGTNGKGSTCAFLERILREHGFKTGWFVSPHLVSERERWRIGGEPISEGALCEYVDDLRTVFDRFGLTYFEATVLIALKLFADQGVDVAVMEVGMGGRWDATKVCEPAGIIITNVQRDHTRWLGDTLWEIAGEKLALGRGDVPMVLGDARYPLFPRAFEEYGYRPLVAGVDFTYRGGVSVLRAVLESFELDSLFIDRAELGLIGRWQVDNSALAVAGASLFAELDTGKVKTALRETRWEGRMEVLRESPLLVVDGSHNPDAVRRVMAELDSLFQDAQVLFTGLEGKEWKESLAIIRRFRDTVFLTEVGHYRGVPLRDLETGARELSFKRVETLASPSEVWELEEDIIALGSLYLVGEVKFSERLSLI